MEELQRSLALFQPEVAVLAGLLLVVVVDSIGAAWRNAADAGADPRHARRRPRPRPQPPGLGAKASIFSGMLVVDPWGGLQGHPRRGRPPDRPRLHVPQRARAPWARAGGALRPRAVAPPLLDAARGGERPRDALPLPGDGLDHVLRDGGLPEGGSDVERGFAEVRPLRRRLHGDDALRPLFLYGLTGTTALPGIQEFLAAGIPRRTDSRSTRSRCSSWSASASRSPPCPSTSGAPTSTRARRRR